VLIGFQTVIHGVLPRYPDRFSYYCVDALDVPKEPLDFHKITDHVLNVLSDEKNRVLIHWYL